MFEKNNPAIALNILHIKKKKYVQLLSQKLIQTVRNKYYSNLILLLHIIITNNISNEGKEGWHYFAVKTINIIKRNNIKTPW